MGVTLRHPEFGTQRSLRHLQGALDALDAGVRAGTIRNSEREEAKFSVSSAYSAEEGELNRFMPHRDVLEAEGMDLWGKGYSLFLDLLPYGIANVRTIPRRVDAARKAGVSPSADAYLRKVEAFAERWSEAHALIVATKDIAVKGRKPMEVSERRSKARTIDHTGSCGCCRQNVKLTTAERSVDHGFNLKYSSRQGSCPGVALLPLEMSPEGIDHMIDIEGKQVAARERRLRALREGDPDVARPTSKRDARVTWVSHGEPDYPRLKHEHADRVGSEVKWLEADLAKLAKAREAWKAAPLPDGRREHLDAATAPSP